MTSAFKNVSMPNPNCSSSSLSVDLPVPFGPAKTATQGGLSSSIPANSDDAFTPQLKLSCQLLHFLRGHVHFTVVVHQNARSPFAGAQAFGKLQRHLAILRRLAGFDVVLLAEPR